MRVEVHTSDRLMFKRCRQRWEFSSNLRMNLEPITVVPPLWFGTGIHLGLAAYYDPRTPRNPNDAKGAFEDFIIGWARDKEDPEQKQFAKDSLDLGLGMLNHYFSVAPKLDRFDIIDVEVPFEVPVPGMSGVTYAGKLDALAYMWDYKKLGIIEHKTTLQFPDSTEWLVMDDQVGSYIWSCSVRGVVPEFVLYNSLKKKAPQELRPLVRGGYSVNKSQDTTYAIALKQLRAVYGAKIPQHYWGFLYHLQDKPDNFIKRDLVRRNRHEIELLGMALREEVLDMVNNPSIYRSPSRINCTGCPFVGPCIAKWEGSNYRSMLATMYRSRDGG